MKIIIVLVFALLVIGTSGPAQAEVNVNISFGTPSQLVMISSGFYYVPGLSYDVFFYNGYWWSRRDGYWYRANYHQGPWGIIKRGYVPRTLFNVRKDYRKVYTKTVSYGQWEKQYGKKAGSRNIKSPGSGQGRGRNK